MNDKAIPLLEAEALTVRFGGLTAVDAVDARLHAGELVGIIGPNGAGKTTFFNAISGVVAPTAGRLRVQGTTDLTGQPPHRFAAHGIARTFQTPRVMADMTLADNVRFGMQFAGRHRAPLAGLDTAGDILALLGLDTLADRQAGDVTPSQQRLLEIGMALGTRPRLLLLDEVAAGLTEAEVEAMARRIRALRDDHGLAVVWIEHAVATLLKYVERVLVLHQGRKIADGAPADVVRNAEVIEAYLGDEMGGRRMNAELRIRGLAAGYHGFQVIQGLDLDVLPGITVVLGPNGAGKTTLLKALAGLLPRAGEAVLDGAALPANDATACVRRGLALVAEGRQLFPQMTVTENLELGGWLTPASLRAERLARAFDDFPRLKERAAQLAGTMSGGEQQMVAVARAMMSGPRLLMLDEPSLGLAPRMVDELLAIVRRIAAQGVTVLMVEQNVRKALAAADRGYVLERGRIVASGDAKQLLDSDVIRRAYLGVA